MSYYAPNPYTSGLWSDDWMHCIECERDVDPEGQYLDTEDGRLCEECGGKEVGECVVEGLMTLGIVIRHARYSVTDPQHKP